MVCLLEGPGLKGAGGLLARIAPSVENLSAQRITSKCTFECTQVSGSLCYGYVGGWVGGWGQERKLRGWVLVQENLEGTLDVLSLSSAGGNML